MASDENVKKQVRNYIRRANELVVKYPKAFNNSIVGRELVSFANRHLGGLDEKPVVAQQQVAAKKKQQFVTHTEQSFLPPTQKKTMEEVVAEGDDYRKMNIDQLKVYAKKEYNIDTKGITRKEDIIHLIDQYVILANAKVEETKVEETVLQETEIGSEELVTDPALTDLDKE